MKILSRAYVSFKSTIDQRLGSAYLYSARAGPIAMTSSVPVDDDSIDAETLQAQIDMSLSFAQDLVTSWIKPSNKMAPRSTRNIEDELKEYMRRPPRYAHPNLELAEM